MSGPNAEAASLGEGIPCAAGVRGDGPCSFELCPPGIGCRRVREQRQQGEAGAVLGPTASLELESACHQLFAASPTGRLGYDEVAAGLEPFVATLVAQARADGAAEERELIMREIECRIDPKPLTEKAGWRSDALAEAYLIAKNARATS